MAVPAADYRPGASAVVGIQTIVTKGVGCDEQKDAEMIAVIFEVWPKTDRKQDYLDIAAELKPLLAKIDGFISIERFESLYEPGKILSLSFFRDETAVKAWRNTLEHRKAQVQGRSEIFANYRLRVASVIRDYGMDVREHVPADSREVHKA
jgi:heme-degrading monooxygenase HmoA